MKIHFVIFLDVVLFYPANCNNAGILLKKNNTWKNKVYTYNANNKYLQYIPTLDAR